MNNCEQIPHPSNTLALMRWELGRVRGLIKTHVLGGTRDASLVVRFSACLYLSSRFPSGFTCEPSLADVFPDAESAKVAGDIRAAHGDMYRSYSVETQVFALTSRAADVAAVVCELEGYPA